MTARALTLLLLAMPAAVPATAHGASLPDLRPAAVSAGSHAHPGGPLRVALRVGAARARAARSGVKIYLGTGPARTKDAVALTGAGRAPALKAGRRASVRLSVTLPATIAPGSYRVIACADDPARVKERNERNNCAAAPLALTVGTAPVSAGSLIAADLAAKKISAERALVLRVEALFGDARLPARYSGDAGAARDDGILRTVGSRWGGLSKSARRALTPFLIAPAARGSWLDPRSGARAAAGADDPCDAAQLESTDWSSFSAAGGKLRFWYRTGNADDRKTAQGYARDLGLTAYPRLKKLFGRDLLSDAGSKCFHGPDGATDVYIVPRLAGRLLGIAIPTNQSPKNNTNCSATPSFIAVEPGLGRWEVTHELVHAFQFTYRYAGDCESYLFWDEATATWGAHFVFPLDDYEHRFDSMALYFFGPLEANDYHGWLYPLFLERTRGEATIPAIYAQFADKGPITGIDAATGGFKARWKEFTRVAWNRPTVAPAFVAWDRFFTVPGPNTGPALTLGGGRKRSVQAPVHVQQLARDYTTYPVTDPKVQEIVYRNRMLGDPGASIWAELTFADGSQRVEDWTDRKDVRFCRSTPGQNVQSIVLMVGNGEWQSERYFLEPSPPPSFDLRDTCEDPLRYEILSASFTAITTGAQSADQYCSAGVSSTRTFTGQSQVADLDVANAVLPRQAGQPALHGELTTRVPASWTDQLSGCDDEQQACSTTKVRTPGGDGFWGMSVEVEAASIDAPTVTLTWAVENPSVGFIDADPSVCNVTEFFQGLPPSAHTQEVPMSDLRANGPTTLKLTSPPLSWTSDFTDDPADLSYTYTYSMTVRRVDESGQPLG